MSIPFTDLDKKYHLPDGCLASVWKQESGCGANQLSGAGARGHFQFMPSTRPEIMAEIGLDPWSKDPRVAADCAGYYLSKLMKQQGGDLEKALASYNAGAGNVNKAERRGGEDWLSHLKTETQNYVPQILSRINMKERINFSRRYANHEASDDEIENERGVRRGLLVDFFGKSEDDARAMGDGDLLGSSFLGMLFSFVKGMMEFMAASHEVGGAPEMPKVPQKPAHTQAKGAKLHA